MPGAYEIPGFSRTSPAGTDFRTGLGKDRFVAMNAAGNVVTPTLGGRAVGVRSNRPNINQATTVCTTGIVMVEAAAAIAIDAAITCSADGRAITAVTGNRIHGRAVTAVSAANGLVSVELSTESVLAL